MRSKYSKILKKKIEEGDPLWLAKSVSRMGRVMASAYMKKQMVGPVNVIVAPSWRCNSLCKMCDLSRRPSKGEMTLEEFKRIVDETAELGASVFSFLGGEPFVRKDMLEMIRYVKSKGIITQVSTNGIELKDAKLAETLISTGIDIITFSLDCMDRETYKNIRGVDRFDDAIAGIKNTVNARNKAKAHTHLNVNLVIMDDNIRDIMKIIRFIKSLGIDLVTPYPIAELGGLMNEQSKDFSERLVALFKAFRRMKDREQVLDMSPEYLDYVINRVSKGAKRIKCFAPISDIHIDPFGYVFPCIYFLGKNEAAGNIRGKSIKELWFSKEYEQLRKNLADCDKCDAMCHVEPALVFNKLWLKK